MIMCFAYIQFLNIQTRFMFTIIIRAMNNNEFSFYRNAFYYDIDYRTKHKIYYFVLLNSFLKLFERNILFCISRIQFSILKIERNKTLSCCRSSNYIVYDYNIIYVRILVVIY